jgi:hypothetical protein
MLGYLILGLALALGLPPWIEPDRQSQYLTRTGVFLSALALDPAGLEGICPKGIPALDHKDVAALPDLIQAVKSLEWQGGQYNQVHFKSADPAALAQRLGTPKARRICFSYEGGAYLLQVQPQTSILSSSLVQTGASSSQAGMAAPISPSQLQRYGFIKSYLDRLEQTAAARRQRLQRIKELKKQIEAQKESKGRAGLEEAIRQFNNIGLSSRLQHEQIEGMLEQSTNLPFYREVRSPAKYESWLPFMGQRSGQAGRVVFKNSAYLVMASAREYSEWVTTEMAGISWARKICGLLLLIWGLWLMRGIFSKRPGIRINPQGAVLFADTVFVIAMAVLSAGLVDYALQEWFGLIPLLDEALQVTFCMMYLPCLLFLANMAANMGGQSLQVTHEGVTWYGPGSKRILSWDDITGLDLRSSYVMVGRLGLPMPRKLQTKLVFKLAGDDEQELFEPGTSYRKGLILEALGRAIPTRLQNDLNRIIQEW